MGIFLNAVLGLGARRQDLAYPIGHHVVISEVDFFADGFVDAPRAPSRQIGDDLVGLGAEVKLGLVKDHPSTGAASSAPERRHQLATEERSGLRVTASRTSHRVQLAAQDLGHHRVGHG